jgi:hypothetical protein
MEFAFILCLSGVRCAVKGQWLRSSKGKKHKTPLVHKKLGIIQKQKGLDFEAV